MEIFRKRYISWLSALAFAFLSTFIVGAAALAATSSGNVTVGLTVPGCVGGCGGGPGPGGGGPTAPSIKNITTTSTATTGQVDWTITSGSPLATVTFVYSTDLSYTSSTPAVGTYQALPTDLLPNTTYFFKITAIDSGNLTATALGSFKTLSNATPGGAPPIISGIVVVTSVNSTTISWTTDHAADSQVIYGLTPGYGQIAFDGAKIISHHLTLTGLTASTTYHFSIISTDALGFSGSTPDATFTTTGAGGPGIPSEICNNGIDDNANGKIDCADAACTSDPICRPAPGVTEICGNGIDDNANGKIDCADTACSGNPSCAIPPGPGSEVCNNGIDDNANGKIDCADSACTNSNSCQSHSGAIEVCNNGIDDDSNGKIDCTDSACAGFSGCSSVSGTTTPGYTPPPSTVGGGGKIHTGELVFMGGNRHFNLTAVNGVVSALAGIQITVGLPNSALAGIVSSTVLKIDGQSYPLSAEATGYYVDFAAPALGDHQGFVEITYQNGTFDSVSFVVRSVPWGDVFSGNQRLIGAKIMLQTDNGVVAFTYDNPNPFITNANGNYGWMMPNGRYKIFVTKDGYYDHSVGSFDVSNNIVNRSVSLIGKPPSLLQGVTAPTSIPNAIGRVAKNLFENTQALTQLGIQKILELQRNPAVQQAAGSVVAPTIVGVATLGTAALISWFDILPLLRLLFLQPLMLLGRRRRKGWGLVYNALTKLPVDLVTIRLLHAETGKVVQTKVTDREGRYAFIAQPGKYRLAVIKNGLTFPSVLLAGFKDDGHRVDIYHGEIIEVTDKDAVIVANIPLDPIGEFKKPIRIFWQRFGRSAQVFLAWSGLIITAISLYLSPHWYVAVLLGVHIVLFILFYRLAMPAKIKSWGIVYDEKSKAPVGQTVARLFSKQFNKLVGTQITDRKGRYYFMVGDGKYYVTYDHDAYETHKTDTIDLTGKEADTIDQDVALKNKEAGVVQPPPPPPPPAAADAAATPKSS